MTTSIPAPKDYKALAEAVDTFSAITQIDTIFYTLDGQLLKNGKHYVTPEDVQQQLSIYANQVFSVFPITLNFHLWGFVICNAMKVSQQRISLSRAYLKTIIDQIFEDDDNIDVNIWEALDAKQLSQIHYFDIFLQNQQSDKTKATIINTIPDDDTGAEISGDIRNNMNNSIQTCLTYIQKNIDRPISLDEVAQNIHLSPSYLSRTFKRTLHINFIDYINTQKIALAGEKLAFSQVPVCQLAKQIGFSQTSYFTKLFKHHTGLTPSKFRQRNQSIQRVITIHRDLTWNDDESIFDISKRFFKDHDIPYYSQIQDGSPYINSIDDLADSTGNRGWIFTVDSLQPTAGSISIRAKGKSVIQWIYTAYSNL